MFLPNVQQMFNKSERRSGTVRILTQHFSYVVVGHRGTDAFSVCIKEKRICIVAFSRMIQFHVFRICSTVLGMTGMNRYLLPLPNTFTVGDLEN